MWTSLVLGIFACGGEPQPLRSSPASPTVTFEAQPEKELVFTDLVPFFSEIPATLPPPLSALVPGMKGDAARAVLEAAHQPGVKIFSRVVDGRVAVASLLAGTESLGVTLLLDGASTELLAVDLSLPDDAAEPLLLDRWGAPTETTMQEGGRAQHVWRQEGQSWTATLMPDPEGKKAILEFSPAR